MRGKHEIGPSWSSLCVLCDLCGKDSSSLRWGSFRMRRPLPPIASLRDFYAFEQHVATCRRHRGLDMVPEWYKVPVFYFSNPASVIGHDDPVFAPRDSHALDYELELACVVGRSCRDLPDDDRALDYVAGFTIMNDW